MFKRVFPFALNLLLAFQARAADTFVADNFVATRVVIVGSTNATRTFQQEPDVVRALFNHGLRQFTGKTNALSAWRSLVKTNDVVGIKIFSAPGPRSGTRSSVVAAAVEGLLSAGLPARQIVIWDKDVGNLHLAGYLELARQYGVRVTGSSEAGYDDSTFYDSSLIGKLVWGEVEFGKRGDAIGRKSFVTKLLTRDITKIINIVPLLNHNLAGTTGHLYSLALGSVDNTQRFEQAGRLNTAVPEIFAMSQLSDKVVLNITDALLCQYQGEQRTLLHYTTALNELWFSKDPVALDVLAINQLQKQREQVGIPSEKKSLEIYENAALLELGNSDDKLIRVERLPEE